MTDGEARDLLGDRHDADDVVEKAQGWPAVLGLASMASISPPDLGAMPHLYGFFADEIYYRLDRRVRRVLCEFALHDTDGRRVAINLLRPDEAKRVIQGRCRRRFSYGHRRRCCGHSPAAEGIPRTKTHAGESEGDRADR